jgi:hypothetical protein
VWTATRERCEISPVSSLGRRGVIELYRVRCADCGVKTEKVRQLPSKAPFSKRFEEAVCLACESAAARRVARQFGLAGSSASHRCELSESPVGVAKGSGLYGASIRGNV